MSDNRFYVYVYIDPRNFQEFYYGKGKGNRIDAHLDDESDSEKTKIIREIKKEGHEPIRKIVVRNLSEDQALLVEKTLIWKLGKTLTNKASGHYADNFRPHSTFHKELYGFDYENGVYHINVGEGDHRSWEDSYKYGFISGGQSWEEWGKKMCGLKPGDILCAYLSGHGYVGIARAIEKACPAIEFQHKDKPLSNYPLKSPLMLSVNGDIKDGEFPIKVEWLSVRDKTDAVNNKSGIWVSPQMLCSLEKQKKTLSILESKFDLSFKDLLSQSVKKNRRVA